jgi:hypothetical protein
MTYRSFGIPAAAVLLAASAVAGTDESTAVATITTMTPLVRVKMKADAAPVTATADMQLPEGSQVITLAGGACEIRFSRAHIMRLEAMTTVTIQRMPKRSAMRILVQLLGGRARAMVDRMRADSDFGMYAATTITAVKGTDYEMTRSATGEVEVEVNEGKVDTAEMKSEDLAEVEKVFGLVLMGQIGMKLIEGSRVRTMPGQRMGRPERIPRAPRVDAAPGSRGPGATPRERPARGRDSTDAAPRGRDANPDTPKPERGGRGGGATPSLPGVGGFGFP